MYCKQCTQPNLTRPSPDAFRPLGLLSTACPVPQTKPFICNHINSFSPYAKANMRRTSGASMFMTDGEPNGDTRAFAANEARRIHCDPQTKSPQSNTLLPRAPSPFVTGESTPTTPRRWNGENEFM